MAASIVALLGSCAEPPPPPQEPVEAPPPPQPPARDEASVTHAVAPVELGPGQERVACYSWTLDNEAPLYVSGVTFSNLGSFHHSNWLVVPDSVYEGPDGVWECEERDFEEQSAAQSGTVLFAQSTQAWTESMAFEEGVVIRIPERSRVVAQLHLLNLAPSSRQTQGWLTLDLLHPYHVLDVLKPLQLTYLGLDIPAQSQVRFTTLCPDPGASVLPPRMTIHYALPHFHGAADYFDLSLQSGFIPTTLLRHEGFGAQPLGRVFDPPIPTEGGGFRLTCGYDNPYSVPLSWGFGIDEMCVVLLLVTDVDAIYSGVVPRSEGVIGEQDGVALNTGTCVLLRTPTGLAYSEPVDDERAAPLYLPPGFDEPSGPPPVPACVDAEPDAEPVAEPTLESLREHVFEPWCGFSACHGAARAAGLDLRAEDLHTALLEHEVLADTPLPLVAPGDPEGSWLYRVVSRCEPAEGEPHMPLNAPVLLDDEAIAVVRAWIEAGAAAD